MYCFLILQIYFDIKLFFNIMIFIKTQSKILKQNGDSDLKNLFLSNPEENVEQTNSTIPSKKSRYFWRKNVAVGSVIII